MSGIKKNFKRAYSMIEIILGLTVVTMLVAGLFVIYNILKTSAEQKSALDRVNTLLAVVNTIRAQTQGVLPAQDTPTPISQIPIFAPYKQNNPFLNNPQYKYACVQESEDKPGDLFLWIPLKSASLCKSVATSLNTRYKRTNSENLAYEFGCVEASDATVGTGEGAVETKPSAWSNKANVLKVHIYGYEVFCQEE